MAHAQVDILFDECLVGTCTFCTCDILLCNSLWKILWLTFQLKNLLNGRVIQTQNLDVGDPQINVHIVEY